jgi:predicted  nucleic acid-binding Zn-ribbon protein
LISGFILSPSFGGFFTYVSFKLNQVEIAKTICIQRKMVFNTCNGRCELQKSIKKYSDNEKEMQNNLKEKTELVYIPNTSKFELNIVTLLKSNENIFDIIESKPVAISLETFRPPSFYI